jgi:hypothetical protein
MIPGLEYEPADGIGNGNGASDNSYYRSPSSQSVSSVNLTPSPAQRQQEQYQTHYDHSYNLQQLHRRRPRSYDDGYGYGRAGSAPSEPEDDKYAKRSASRLAKRLDIFPKTERDYTVRTERGGLLTAIGYAIMAMLMLAEWTTWRKLNRDSLEHIVVDTRYVRSFAIYIRRKEKYSLGEGCGRSDMMNTVLLCFSEVFRVDKIYLSPSY